MKVYINFQTQVDVIEGWVADEKEFFDWCCKNLRNRGKKLFLVLPGEESKDFYLTSSIDDIECFFEYVFMGDKLFIQEFEYGDYKDAIGYLADLFETQN